MTDDSAPTPDELDDGLAFVFGQDSKPQDAPSVLDRIGEVTGSKPKVLLRDDRTGETPMLKPLGPGDSREAGKYVVHGELGRGGVGSVHRGHDQDLGRDVAMKFLHDKYKDEAQLLHRFVEEAQIGGQLQHPGIVPVYDLGLVDGRPFFAMKLVKGETLAKKLAERESPADDRRSFLAIFEDICQTMAYAHARGVVHRDLKPANVMIGWFGEVQVVDWGMGKVLERGGVADERAGAARHAEVSVIETVRSSGQHESQSIVGSVMGTLAYMPPEQARGDVDAMDERSDVFALGAILCEILTGRPPYVGEQADLISMAAMAKLDDAHARLAACDGDPEMVELATRCLMPAPAARPRSAEVVAKSVHDHLAAVEARVHEARVEAAEAKVRAAALKRTQTLGISLIAVIAAGLLVSLWFWRAADEAAENERVAHAAAAASAVEAQENEQVAKRELARAVEIKNLITGLLESVTPEQAQGADTTLLEGILETASKKLAEGAIQDELVAAELHDVTGSVYQTLARYPESERHLSVALELRRRELGEEHPSTLATRNNLSILFIEQGRYAEAEPLAVETLELQRRVLGEEHPDTIRIMNNLAVLYSHQGRNEEAEAICLEALAIQRRVRGEEHPGTLAVLANLAMIYSDQGRYEDAEPVYLETLEINRRVQGADHPDTLSSMNNLAGLYDRQGRYAESEALYLEALERVRHVYGDEHPQTLGSITNLGILYNRIERFEDAAAMFETSLPIKRRVLGMQHPWSGLALRGLVIAYVGLGRYDEAVPLQRERVELRVAEADQEGADAMTLGGAAWTLLTVQPASLQDPVRALGFAEQACALLEDEGGEPLRNALETLALAQHRTGDSAAAVETQRRALALAPEGADPGIAARLAEYEAAAGD